MAFYRIAMKQYMVREGNVQEEWTWHSAVFRDHVSLMGAVSMFYRGSTVIIFGATSTNRLEDSLQDFNEGRLCVMVSPADLLAGRLPFDDAAIVKAEQIVDNERIVESREVQQRKTEQSEEKVQRRLKFYHWLYMKGKLHEFPGCARIPFYGRAPLGYLPPVSPAVEEV